MLQNGVMARNTLAHACCQRDGGSVDDAFFAVQSCMLRGVSASRDAGGAPPGHVLHDSSWEPEYCMAIVTLCC